MTINSFLGIHGDITINENAPRTCEQECIIPFDISSGLEASEAKSQCLGDSALPAKLQQRKQQGGEELHIQLCMSTAGSHLLLDPESESVQQFF